MNINNFRIFFAGIISLFRRTVQLKKRQTCLFIFYLILLVSFLPADVFSADEKNKDAASLFDFAETLFAEGDYYRAITEYKRVIFFSPEDPLAEKATFRIGESYFKAKKWLEAIEAFDFFRNKYPRSTMTTEALYLEGLAEKELKRYENSLSSFQIIINSQSEQYADKAVYQTALVFLDSGDWPKAKNTFLLVPPSSSLASPARIMAEGLEKADGIPRKKPATAGFLAAVLPGSGHVYTERYRDAAMAFLLNGAFILAAVELFRSERYAAGGVVTFFEILWYSGNIYSAVSSAHKYNEREKNKFLENLKKTSGLSLSYDPATSSPLLSFSFRY
jgi:hypothetical protein